MKIRTVMAIAPFANDPFDAVASFAFQIALVAAILSLARLVSIKAEDGLKQRTLFILRSILLVEITIFVTLLTDLVAILLALPLPFSQPMLFLLGGLFLLVALFILTGVLLVHAWKELHPKSNPPAHDSLGQTIRDCWNLVAAIGNGLVRLLPFLKRPWQWLDGLIRRIGNLWKKHLPTFDPDLHPWYFFLLFVLLAGVFIVLIILTSESLVEGPPVKPGMLLILFGIFFGGEVLAGLLGFLFFGGWLGLRPNLIRRANHD